MPREGTPGGGTPPGGIIARRMKRLTENDMLRGVLLLAVDSPGMEEWVRSNFGRRMDLPPPVQLTNHLLEAVTETEPDLVILSRHLPGDEAVGAVLPVLRRRHPRARVILLVGELDDEGQELVELAIAHGVFDLLPGGGPILEEDLTRLIFHPAAYADAVEFCSLGRKGREDGWRPPGVGAGSVRERTEQINPPALKRGTVGPAPASVGSISFKPREGAGAFREHLPPREETAGRAVVPVGSAVLRGLLGKIGRFGGLPVWSGAGGVQPAAPASSGSPGGGRRTGPVGRVAVAKEIGVWSVKGGVGKTTVVANLLACARSRGMAVVGLDADVRACGLLPAFGVEQPERGMEALPEMLHPECFARTKDGIYLLPGRGRVATAVPDVPRERFLAWLEYCRKHFELTVLDLDPLAEETTTLTGLQAATTVYVVVESFLPSVELNRDKLQVFDRIPSLVQIRRKCRLVINKWDGTRDTPREIAERTGLPVAAVIPFDQRYAWAREPYLPGGGEGKRKGPWTQLLVDVLQNLPERKRTSSPLTASGS